MCKDFDRDDDVYLEGDALDCHVCKYYNSKLSQCMIHRDEDEDEDEDA